MKFVENFTADDTLDLVCRMCPLHLLEPGEKLSCLKKGQVLEVLTDYDGALEDIPEWCEKCGQVSDVDLPVNGEIDRRAAQKTGFEVSSHWLEFRGLCWECQDK